MSRKQPTPVERPQSAAAAEIVALMGRVGSDAGVPCWTNPNGWLCCASAVRADLRRVRFYAEGLASEDAAEVSVLAGIKALIGGVK